MTELNTNFNLKYDTAGMQNDVEVDVEGTKGQVVIDVTKGAQSGDSISQSVVIDLKNMVTGAYSTSSATPVLNPSSLPEELKEELSDKLAEIIGRSLVDGKTPTEIREMIADHLANEIMEELGLKPPTDIKQRDTTDIRRSNTDAVEKLTGNPWFAVSFLAVFTSIMDEVLNLQRKNRYMEAQVELKTRENILELSKTQSDLTKALYENQAMEKFVDAIMSFVQAGISLATVAMLAGSWGRAKIEAKNEIKAEKKALKELEVERDLASNQNINALTDPVKAKALLLQKQADIAKAEEDISKQKQFIKHLEEKPTMRDTVMKKQQHNDQLATQTAEVAKHLVNGMNSIVQGILLSERGTIEASKTINDGYMQLLNKYAESTGKARDEAQANFDKILEFVNKIVDSTFRAHSLGHSI